MEAEEFVVHPEDRGEILKALKSGNVVIRKITLGLKRG